MYNNLVERCFKECIEDMRSKSMSSKEEQVRCNCAGGSVSHSTTPMYSRLLANGISNASVMPVLPLHAHTQAQCVAKCCEKFMNVTGRVGMRFSEFFSQMEAAAAEQMKAAQSSK